MGLKEFYTESLKIPALKAAASSHYKSYCNAVDRLSCGASLGEHISSDAAKHKQRFNEIMDELSKIDSSCPDFRL